MPVHKIGHQSHALDFTDLPYGRGDAGPVQPVQFPGQLFHVRELTGAPAEHLGDQGVHGRRVPLQLGEQTDAQAAGFKLVRGDAGEPHPGQNLISNQRHCCLSFFLISKPEFPKFRRLNLI